MRAFNPRQAAFFQSAMEGVAWMNRKARLRGMAHQMGYPAGAGHGVPLVSRPAGIEDEMIAVWRPLMGCTDRNHAGPAAGKGEASTGKQSWSRTAIAWPGTWPLHRRKRVVTGIVQACQGANVENAGPAILECRKRGMFAEDGGRSGVGEFFLPAH